MSPTTLAQIEALLDDLSPEEQLLLIERLVGRLREPAPPVPPHSRPLLHAAERDPVIGRSPGVRLPLLPPVSQPVLAE